MGFYGERVLPRIVDRACGTSDIGRWRDRAAEGLRGDVVEIGFGSGHDLDHLPGGVRRVHAVEPSEVAFGLAADRIATSPIPVERHLVPAERLPLDDHSCDGALSTFTLCTIPDVATALAELRRVLRPGAPFHFLEHGLSPDARTARWQRRLEPLQRRLVGGCHLTRDPVELVGAAGFELVWSSSSHARGPAPWTWFTVGVARNP